MRSVVSAYASQHLFPADLASFGLAARGAPPAELPTCKYPPPEELIALTSREEVAAATARVIQSATRLLSIYSADMEPELYAQEEVAKALRRFVLTHRFAKVRVLARNWNYLATSDDTFAILTRRLNSYIEIRTYDDKNKDPAATYCIADDHGLVYRLRSDRWDGVTTHDNARIARYHLNAFDQGWANAHRVNNPPPTSI